MATKYRPRHHQAATVGRHRPQLDPPRFTQAPTQTLDVATKTFPSAPAPRPIAPNRGISSAICLMGLTKKWFFIFAATPAG
jgi:hypothetical protein